VKRRCLIGLERNQLLLGDILCHNPLDDHFTPFGNSWPELLTVAMYTAFSGLRLRLHLQPAPEPLGYGISSYWLCIANSAAGACSSRIRIARQTSPAFFSA